MNGTTTYYTAGNVGIGTTTPVAKLHVEGNIYGSLPRAATFARTLAGGGNAPNAILTGAAAINFGDTTLTLDGPGRVIINAHVTFANLTGDTSWIGISVRAVQGATVIVPGDHMYVPGFDGRFANGSVSAILNLPSGGAWTLQIAIHKPNDGVTATVHTYSINGVFIGK